MGLGPKNDANRTTKTLTKMMRCPFLYALLKSEELRESVLLWEFCARINQVHVEKLVFMSLCLAWRLCFYSGGLSVVTKALKTNPLTAS